MTDQKKPRRNRRRKPQYKQYPFASHVTIYSADGSPVPEDVLAEFELAMASIALENRLITAVNRA